MYGSMRVTQRSMADRTLANLQDSLGRMGKVQNQLSSGKMIMSPSDDPTGTVSAMQMRSEQQRLVQWRTNADDGVSWLSTIDGALSGSLGQVRRARDLVVQGLNTGSTDSAARSALADEVDQIREQLLGVANTTYLDRPVFGGTTKGGVAYAPDGSYVGDSATVSRTIGSNMSVRVDITGPEVFAAGGTDLFSELTTISTALRSDPGQLGDALTRLDTVRGNMTAKLSDVGARLNRVQQAQEQIDTRKMDLATSLSQIESPDMAKSILDMQILQSGYQAALAATSKVLQPSLVEFLR